MATMVSTYAIQTLGIDAIREGNQIVVGEMHLGVVDACSGLRMLTIFVALSVAIVMLGDLEWYEGLVILASAIPIALAVNAIRITLTGVMYTIDPAIAEKIFHDWAGYFMMPLALGMLYLLQRLLSKLFVPEHEGLTAVVPLGTTVDGGGHHRPSGQAAAVPVFQAGMLMSGRKGDATGHGNDKTG
jgi:exosortase/archaeosortase family protein